MEVWSIPSSPQYCGMLHSLRVNQHSKNPAAYLQRNVISFPLPTVRHRHHHHQRLVKIVSFSWNFFITFFHQSNRFPYSAPVEECNTLVTIPLITFGTHIPIASAIAVRTSEAKTPEVQLTTRKSTCSCETHKTLDEFYVPRSAVQSEVNKIPETRVLLASVESVPSPATVASTVQVA